MIDRLEQMEQRYDAVLMVIKDGYSVSEVARKVKVSRQTLYKWLADYEASGLKGLDDRSHRPHHVPHQLDGAREAQIIALRLAHHVTACEPGKCHRHAGHGEPHHKFLRVYLSSFFDLLHGCFHFINYYALTGLGPWGGT